MSADDTDNRVLLVRMEGKIDLMNERHESTKADILDVKTRLHVHGNRIGNLEARDHQRTGAVGAVKVVWGISGFTLMGVIGVVLKLAGAA